MSLGYNVDDSAAVKIDYFFKLENHVPSVTNNFQTLHRCHSDLEMRYFASLYSSVSRELLSMCNCLSNTEWLYI